MESSVPALFAIIIVLSYIASILHYLTYSWGTKLACVQSSAGLVLDFAADDWHYIGTKKSVDLFIKHIPNSKLLAFKGSMVLDMHISDVLGPYSNLSYAKSWVDMLKFIDKYELLEPGQTTCENKCEPSTRKDEEIWHGHHDLVHQELNLPWPITPRELLLRRDFEFWEHNKTVVVRYHSIDDDVRFPVTKRAIRADSPHTMWTFSALHIDGESISEDCSDGACNACCSETPKKSGNIFKDLLNKMRPKNESSAACECHTVSASRNRSTATRLDVESFVDSKGSIPTWFINYMQKTWPAYTITHFAKKARQAVDEGVVQPYAKVRHW